VGADTDRLIVVARMEFGAIAAPGGVRQHTVISRPRRRKPQRDDLSDRSSASGGICPATCEASHIRPPGSALSMRSGRATPTIEDGTNENAAEGILVVQVRPLGTISPEIPELAIRRLCGASVGQ
jgi:hypothetical protein